MNNTLYNLNIYGDDGLGIRNDGKIEIAMIQTYCSKYRVELCFFIVYRGRAYRLTREI